MSQGAAGDAGSGTHMLRGSVWMIGLRWAMRLTGLVSTVVLARLLTPADFGVVAIAMIVVGMFEVLSETGQELALIRHHDPIREHYDTAWTLSVIVGFGVGAAIFLTAPLTTVYFHDGRSVIVMQCLALRPIMCGLENVGTLDFRRNLRFERVFSYNFYAKLFSFLVTVSLAVVLRNYWALVAGILSGQFARTVLSYIMHPHRPRISFAKISEIWAFSIWILLRSIGEYCVTQIGAIAVGGALGTISMGRYTVAKDLASSPTDEIVTPMVWGVLFPVMSRYQHDPQHFRELYLRILGWSLIIAASTGLGLWLVAPDMVALILGSEWISITPLVQWLALEASIASLNHAAYTVLNVRGIPEVGARLLWIRFFVLTISVVPVAFLTHNLLALVIVHLLVTVLLLPPVLIAAGRHSGVMMTDYASIFWRPFTAGGTMVLAVWSLNQVLGISGSVRLGLDITAGVIVYVTTLMALWNISGRPLSAERDVSTLIRRAQIMFGAIRGRVLDTAQ